MIKTFTVIDDFCPQSALVRNSALMSGFGTWKPNAGVIGKDHYEGMNFVGEHGVLLRCLTAFIGQAIYPHGMFFRASKVEDPESFVHSDRMWGQYTCIVYLSEHTETSGTGFYRHRATGATEMPAIAEMHASGDFHQFKEDMAKTGAESDAAWEQMDVIRGNFNRALIFHAPLFHCRWPKTGIGTTEHDARMVWVCHFDL